MPASRPSIPDRKRLDSDVRAFMRQPSTPWITFDRDSRVAQGEAPAPLVFAAAMFPEGPAAPPVSEPSNVVVATDVVPTPMPTDAPFSLDEVPVRTLGRRAVWAAAIFAGVLGIAAGSAAAVSVASSKPAAAAQAMKAPP